jgi:hypothetical protein
MRSATLDDRRRLVMPQECPLGSAVTIQELDTTTLPVKRQLPDRDFKTVMIPMHKGHVTEARQASLVRTMIAAHGWAAGL